MSENSAGESFTIQPEAVHDRNESGSKLFGLMTLGEMVLVIGAFIGASMVLGGVKIGAVAGMFAWLYVKKIKSQLPERFFSSAFKWLLRKEFVYRAMGRDTQWRPPVIR